MFLRDFFATLFGDEYWTDGDEAQFAENVLSDLLPYRVYEAKDRLYHNDGTTGFIFETVPNVGQGDVAAGVHAVLNGQCPVGGSVQILNWASPDIDGILGRWDQVRRQRGALIGRMAGARCNHIGSLRFGSDHQVKCVPHRRRVFVAGWIDGEAAMSEAKALRDLRRALVGAFGGPAMCQDLDPRGLINVLSELLHAQALERGQVLDYDESRAINAQLQGAAIHHVRAGLELYGDPPLSLSLASLRKTPREWQFGLGHTLNGAPDRISDRARGPVLTSFTARAMASQEASGLLMKKRASTQHTASTGFAKFAINLGEKQQEFDQLHSAVEAGERLFECAYVVAAYGLGGADEAREALVDLGKIYRQAGFQLENDKLIQLPLFLSALPFGIQGKRMGDLKKLQRMKLLKGEAVAALMPIHGEYCGVVDPHSMLMVGRQGQLYFWDNYVSGGNYNVSVVGKSGAGKSVFMQELVTSIYASGGRVVVIDDGHSFRNTAEILGGAWIGFDGSREIRLNPFSMLDATHMESEEYANDAILLITRVIATMAALGEQRSGRVAEVEEDYIREAARAVWAEKGAAGEVTDVLDRLTTQVTQEERLGDVVLKLRAYARGGAYGRYFEGTSNLKLDNAFTVFELSDIKSQKGLEAVVLQIVMFLATELMFKTPRQERVAILIDEAWDLLHADGTAKFIEGVVRRARKYTGALITGTQSVNDYYANEAAKVCWENSDWSVFLAQKPETIETLQKDARLAVSTYVADQLKSLTSVPGRFAEFGIKGASGWSFGRLLLDPFSLTVFSSKGETVERVKALQAQGHSIAEAVELVADSGEAR